MEGMILQVVFADDHHLQVSDGMNTCYLNVSRENSTIEALCRKINKSATRQDLLKSIFVVADFLFEFDWDYENKRLMVSLDTDEFDFLHPGAMHEKVFRSKDLTSVLGNLERETLKRNAMKKKLSTTSFVGIDMGELIGITSTGGLVIDDELQVLNELVKPNILGKNPLTTSDMSNLVGKSKAIEPEMGSITKSLMKNGWLTFPVIESDGIPVGGGIFETFDEFVLKCNRIFTQIVNKKNKT